MNKESVILVTGANGMVGSRLVNELRSNGYSNVTGSCRTDCDLTDAREVNQLFARVKPDIVFHLAAKVGGIQANRSDPCGFLTENLKIQTNTFESALKHDVKKQMFLGSSCIYPRECPQPMREEYLLSGALEPTNEAYALAKITGLKLASYYHRQHGLLTVCPMPCNIYGENDSFDLNECHVLSALVRRFSDAKDAQAPSVTLWGTGSARREFIHVDDVVAGMIHLIDACDSPDIINLGTGTDVSIKELAGIISEEVGYKGVVEWDSSKPDGMPRKCLDTTRLQQLGFTPQVPLLAGIRSVIEAYRSSETNKSKKAS